jgi:IclR family pca regulon transcriptional regulator
MAEIEKARAQGWYLIDQELELGVRAVAAPVRDRSGQIVAAVNVSTAVARMTQADMIENVVPRVVRTADDISAALHNR